MNLKETYNKIAKDWHKDHKQDDWWIEGTNTFISLLFPGSLVLDAGCGSGVKTKYLMDHGLRAVGTDISEEMIRIAEKEAPDAEFRVLSFYDIDSLDKMFDGIFMQASLLHVKKSNAQEVVRAFSQKIKPGGYFYIAVKRKRDGGVEEEIREENDYGYPYQRFFSYYTPKEIEEYFNSAGLTVVYNDALNSDTSDTKWIQIIGQK